MRTKEDIIKQMSSQFNMEETTKNTIISGIIKNNIDIQEELQKIKRSLLYDLIDKKQPTDIKKIIDKHINHLIFTLDE